MQMAKINGITLHYADHGSRDSTAIVFANSLGTDFRIWDRVAAELESEFRIVRYDKRGHGLSDCPPAPYAMQDHVDDLAALLDHLEIKRAVIVGLSVGGMIAQGLFQTRPDLVLALVLSDTAHKIGDTAAWNARIEAVREHGIAALSDAVLARWFTDDFRKHRADEFAVCSNMLNRSPAEGYAGTCAALRDADFTDLAPRIDVPTMLMVGSNDGSNQVDIVRTTHDLIQGSRFVVIEGPGHLPCIDEPEEVARLVRGFIHDSLRG